MKSFWLGFSINIRGNVVETLIPTGPVIIVHTNVLRFEFAGLGLGKIGRLSDAERRYRS